MSGLNYKFFPTVHSIWVFGVHKFFGISVRIGILSGKCASKKRWSAVHSTKRRADLLIVWTASLFQWVRILRNCRNRAISVKFKTLIWWFTRFSMWLTVVMHLCMRLWSYDLTALSKSGSIWSRGKTKIRSITKYYKISWNDLSSHQQSSHEAIIII